MSEIELLKKNPNKLANLLSCALSQAEQDKIINIAHKHTKLLMKLSRHHLLFAISIKGNYAWRQKVSRSYYACYNASKALRLFNRGHYSQESKDHEKIGDLPKTFNDKPFWDNFLTKLRSDRNLADYDHVKKSIDMEYTPKEYLKHSEKFFNEAKAYLKDRSIL